jgi:hypothetical protein
MNLSLRLRDMTPSLCNPLPAPDLLLVLLLHALLSFGKSHFIHSPSPTVLDISSAGVCAALLMDPSPKGDLARSSAGVNAI